MSAAAGSRASCTVSPSPEVVELFKMLKAVQTFDEIEGVRKSNELAAMLERYEAKYPELKDK